MTHTPCERSSQQRASDGETVAAESERRLQAASVGRVVTYQLATRLPCMATSIDECDDRTRDRSANIDHTSARACSTERRSLSPFYVTYYSAGTKI